MNLHSKIQIFLKMGTELNKEKENSFSQDFDEVEMTSFGDLFQLFKTNY